MLIKQTAGLDAEWQLNPYRLLVEPIFEAVTLYLLVDRSKL
jgi:hypothetical protein